jgi:cyclopropane-fatty-acyl-phospholipid synthase
VVAVITLRRRGLPPTALGRAIDDSAIRAALAAASRIRVGHLTVRLPDGSSRDFGDPGSSLRGELRLHDPAALRRLLLGGEVGMGEAYMDGQWSSPDLVGLITLAVANREALALGAGRWSRPQQAVRTLEHRRRRNTRSGSRRNIRAHYDLGNEFYALWLDETMTYSSAVFGSNDQSLADAQRHKYERLADLADLRPGQHVLEIGSGWGGFAIHAARERGCRVTGITISEAQLRLARERVRAAGVEELVEFRLQDYRDVTDRYDAIVSIEMLEAVGADYLATFFRSCDAALVDGGRLALQVITFRDDAFRAQLAGANWIQRHIFPGGELPSLAAIDAALAGTRLLVTRVDDIRHSYARTLATWREAFMRQREAVRGMGFDDRFLRMWEYYLAISEAGFRTGLCQDFQIGLQRGRGMT